MYTPDSGMSYELGVSAVYPFMKNHALMFRASYESFASEVSDSPIVDEDNSTSFGVGYIYRF